MGGESELQIPALPLRNKPLATSQGLAPWTGAPCSRFCVHGLKTMGDLDFLYAAPDMTACAAFSKESRKRPANATKLHRKSGGSPSFFFSCK